MQLFLYGVGITMLYIIVAVGVMLIARKYLTIPDELFRKILHFILLGAYIPLVFAFETWWMAVIFALFLNENVVSSGNVGSSDFENRLSLYIGVYKMSPSSIENGLKI